MIQQKRKAESLAIRLRKPIRRIDDTGTPNVSDLTDKMNAIGEALAYLIDKKWAKQKLGKQRKAMKKRRD